MTPHVRCSHSWPFILPDNFFRHCIVNAAADPEHGFGDRKLERFRHHNATFRLSLGAQIY